MNKYQEFSKAEEKRAIREALYEENIKKAQSINRQIITKPGTKLPTDKEVEKMSGEVVTSFIPTPISWETFSAFTPEKKKAWLTSMFETYQGISAMPLAELFRSKYYRDILHAINDAGLGKGRGNKGKFLGKEKFEAEMLGRKLEPKVKKEISSETIREMIILPPKEEPSPAPIILSASFICDANQVAEMIERIGFKGNVKIHIETAAI